MSNNVESNQNATIQINSKEELLQYILKRYPNTTDYQLYVSGKTIKIPAYRLPFLIGKNTSNICILAYINGKWWQLPFTFSEGPEITQKVNNRAFVIRNLPRSITKDTIVLIKMPEEQPTITNPMKNTPPQARGAKEWHWIYVKPGESRYSYPIFIALNSPQIQLVCGSTPNLYSSGYTLAGELKGPGVPWLLKIALNDKNISVDLKVIKDIMKPVEIYIDQKLTTKYGPPHNYLPDGGGGSYVEKAYISLLFTPKELVSSGNKKYFEDLIMHLSGGESKTFSLKLYSPYTNIPDYNITFKKLIITLYGKISDENSYDVSTFDIILYPNTQYQKTYSITLISMFGYGDFNQIIYDPESDEPYRVPLIPPGEIPVKVRLRDNTDKEWILSAKVEAIAELVNYKNYIPNDIYGEFKYKLMECARIPCYETGYRYPIRVIISSGQSNSSHINLYSGLPIEVALFNNEDNFNSYLSFNLSFTLKLPPGFPGGSFNMSISDIGTCEKSIESNPSVNYAYVSKTCKFTIKTNKFVDILSKPYSIIDIWIKVPSSNHPLYVVNIYLQNSDYIAFKNLPYIKIPYTSSEFFLTPLMNYSSNSDYLGVPIMRETVETNKHGIVSNYLRWIDLKWSLASHSYLLINFAISPTEPFFEMNNSDAGNLESFEITVEWDGTGDCVNPSVETKAIVKSNTMFENIDWSTLQEIINWVSATTSWLSTKVKIIGFLSSSLSIANLVLDYKDLTKIDIQKSCYSQGTPGGYTRAYIKISGDEEGWDPSEFANSIDIYINNFVFNGPHCVNVKQFTLKFVTEDGFVSYDEDFINKKFCRDGYFYVQGAKR